MALVTGRRELTLVVLLCAVGAVVTLVAAGQTWSTAVTDRPAPLPALVSEQTGGEFRPWLPALGWVALAGAGALLATRRWLRRLVGGLLVAAGAGAVVGAVTVLAGGVADELRWGWPGLAVVGGLLVVLAGVVTGARSRRWPSMGARYDRSATGAPGGTAPAGERRDGAVPGGGAGGSAAGDLERSAESLWDALDRGEDPTSR